MHFSRDAPDEQGEVEQNPNMPFLEDCIQVRRYPSLDEGSRHESSELFGGLLMYSPQHVHDPLGEGVGQYPVSGEPLSEFLESNQSEVNGPFDSATPSQSHSGNNPPENNPAEFCDIVEVGNRDAESPDSQSIRTESELVNSAEVVLASEAATMSACEKKTCSHHPKCTNLEDGLDGQDEDTTGLRKRLSCETYAKQLFDSRKGVPEIIQILSGETSSSDWSTSRSKPSPRGKNAIGLSGRVCELFKKKRGTFLYGQRDGCTRSTNSSRATKDCRLFTRHVKLALIELCIEKVSFLEGSQFKTEGYPVLEELLRFKAEEGIRAVALHVQEQAKRVCEKLDLSPGAARHALVKEEHLQTLKVLERVLPAKNLDIPFHSPVSCFKASMVA